ncbi:putative glycolipid-binding domain-containing protein [Niabella sp. 22666]|uniref:putative glycolipid-binding domain-containing protein n=1 Tax=Niabella sp. 22666 TaxID=3453954 RepID=UPI003F8514D7
MKSLIWKGILYNSTEHLQISESQETIQVESGIIGSFQESDYVVRYRAEITKDWTVTTFHIISEVNGSVQEISGTKENSSWIINGEPDTRFTDFSFIDISLSPFTNTLPINNLDMAVGGEQEITVIYIDILEEEIRPTRQRYSKISEATYRYENVYDDFRANIRVDEEGFVLFYPGLFERSVSTN